MAKTYLATKEDLTPLHDSIIQLQADQEQYVKKDEATDISICGFDPIDAMFGGED